MDKDIFIKLLAQREFKAVRSILDVMNEVDIASLLSELDDKELALAFRRFRKIRQRKYLPIWKLPCRPTL